MALLASEVIAEARGLLNDPSGAIYPTAPMVVLLNKVYKELQTKVSALGVSTTKEISQFLPVPAGTARLGDGAGLPASLLYPIWLKERALGTADKFIDMTEVEFEPYYTTPPLILQYWAWREDELKFAICSANREILVRFVQTLGAVTATTSPILILNSQQWLAQRLGAVASALLGSNPARAKILQDDLVEIWDDLRITLVRRKQSLPTRRRLTRYRAR